VLPDSLDTLFAAIKYLNTSDEEWNNIIKKSNHEKNQE